MWTFLDQGTVKYNFQLEVSSTPNIGKAKKDPYQMASERNNFVTMKKEIVTQSDPHQ